MIIHKDDQKTIDLTDTILTIETTFPIIFSRKSIHIGRLRQIKMDAHTKASLIKNGKDPKSNMILGTDNESLVCLPVSVANLILSRANAVKKEIAKAKANIRQ